MPSGTKAGWHQAAHDTGGSLPKSAVSSWQGWWAEPFTFFLLLPGVQCCAWLLRQQFCSVPCGPMQDN